MNKNILTGLLFASLLLGSFYLGVVFAIDIFEFYCFRTSL